MCDPTYNFSDKTKPEVILAKLIGDNINHHADPKMLRLFIKLHWEKIRSLAHEIHKSE